MSADAVVAGNDQQLRAALDSLRSSGIHSATEIDPVLLAALGVPSHYSLGEARELVRRRLLAHAERLDPKLRIALLESAGFRRDAPTSSVARMQAAADNLGISLRSAYRRTCQAILQVAALIQSNAEQRLPTDVDYVYVRARIRVDFTRGYPSQITERTVSARTDGLEILNEFLHYPKLRGTHLDLIALEGCTVAANTQVAPGMWAVQLRLRHTLALGEQHTFSFSVRLPDHASMDPLVGFLPHTESMDATVEFNFGDRRPVALEQFSGPPPVSGVVSPTESISIAPQGQRHMFELPQMRPGFCYGIRWQWPEEAEPDPASPAAPGVPVL